MICSSCSSETLILYPAEPSQTVQWALINIIGSSDKEPPDCLYLWLCNACHNEAAVLQGNTFTDGPAVGSILDDITNIHTTLKRLQEKIVICCLSTRRLLMQLRPKATWKSWSRLRAAPLKHNIKEIYSTGYREVPLKVTRIAKITKFKKTAKFTIIRQTTFEINEIYSKGCREGPPKVTKITKFTIIRHTSYNINKIYSKGYREGTSKVTKIPKFMKIGKTIDKV